MIAEHVDTWEFGPFDREQSLFRIRELVTARRQFSFAPGPGGSATISAPKVGHRNPATPQPTPPQAEALRLAA